MAFEWEYPIAVIAHGGGYASVIESEERGGERHSLIVVTETEASLELMQRLGILGAPRIIGNAREFRWLVQSLRKPVSHVAFDIDPVEDQPNPQWSVSIEELLRNHLIADFSPWNYPIYVVAVEHGFLCIASSTSDGRELTAVTVFRSKSLAAEYIEASQPGEICTIKNLQEAVRFFSAVSEVVDAVALDPSIVDGQASAEHCFAIETLLDKYLVEDTGEADGPGP